MHAPSTHTGLPSDLLAAATASMACPSTSCAAHSSTGTHADAGTAGLTRPSRRHDTVIACATSWSILVWLVWHQCSFLATTKVICSTCRQFLQIASHTLTPWLVAHEYGSRYIGLPHFGHLL